MKKLLLYILFIIAGFTVQAQNGTRLEALKIAYITKKMDLSPEDAQKFWPIYNQYAAELRQARQYAQRNNQSEIELDEVTLGIRKKYNSQFTQVLPPEKVNAFFKSEKEFGVFVQKEMERRELKTQRRNENRQ
ncbi:MAG: hypothetical protein Q8918_09495 [Bacteroidota bacterium]|nr:hypothetical protein [Bacteroidota bacterium]MDP4213262.1 hypothetical protein [Bacteroidota bacterium]MDP4250325.1 hypothetical protein [Bacteroidota bacterium]